MTTHESPVFVSPFFLLLSISEFCSSYPCHDTTPFLPPTPIPSSWAFFGSYYVAPICADLYVFPWLHMVCV